MVCGVVLGERAFPDRLEGSCRIPVAGHGRLAGDTAGDTFHMTGLVADIDGKIVYRETISGPRKQTRELGIQLANRLLSRGAREILESIKANAE